jgi:hypothetical protein
MTGLLIGFILGVWLMVWGYTIVEKERKEKLRLKKVLDKR